MPEQSLELELFSPEEAKQVYELLGNMVIQQEVVYEELSVEIDLESLVMEDFGISDPVGQIIHAIKDLLNSIASWIVDRIKDLFDDFKDKVINPAVEALKNLVESIYNGIVDSLHQVYDYLSSVASELSNAISNAISVLSDALSNIGNAISNVMSSISDLAQNIATVISNLFESIKNVISSAVDDIIKGVSDLISGLSDLLNKAVSAMGDLVSKVESLANTVESALSDFVKKVTDALSGIWDAIKDIGSKIADSIKTIISEISNVISDAIKDLWSGIQSVFAKLSDVVSKAINLISTGFEKIGSFFEELGEKLGTVVKEIVEKVSGALEEFGKKVLDVFEKLGSAVKSLIGDLWKGIQSLGEKLVGALTDVMNLIKTGFENIGSYFEKFATTISGFIDKMLSKIEGLLKSFFADIWKGMQSLIGGIEKLLNEVYAGLKEGISGLEGILKEAFTSIENTISNLTRTLSTVVATVEQGFRSVIAGIEGVIKSASQTVINTILDALKDLYGSIENAIKTLVAGILNEIRKLVQGISDIINKIISTITSLEQAVESGFEEVGTKFADWATQITHGLAEAGTALAQMTKSVERLGLLVMGGFNQLLMIPEKIWHMVPEWFKNAFKNIKKGFEYIVEGFDKPEEFFEKVINVFKTVWGKVIDLLKIILEKIASVIKEASGFIKDVITTALSIAGGMAKGSWAPVMEVVDPLFFEPTKNYGKDIGQSWVENLRQPKDALELMFDIARGMLFKYYKATLGVYMFAGIVRALGDFEIDLVPEFLANKVAGARYRIRISEIAEHLVKVLEEFYPYFVLGAMFGLARTLMAPVEFLYRPKFIKAYGAKAKEFFSDVLSEEIKEGARIDLFIEMPTITELREWVRRNIAVAGGIPLVTTEGGQRKGVLTKELTSLFATYRAHLKLRGLPEWFIDYMTDAGQNLVITFTDRFGMSRGVWLGLTFELPTHTELARMTQRDIFPSVYEMQKVAWVRGWNPDMTTLMYLLTFKYPSFEKLWRFYMRATAGMLWFSPPPDIAEVFKQEALAIGAGIPVAPLDMQRKITGPDQLQAFELAINTYFKWLEYSNFSWFTQHTQLYNVPVGAKIYGALGGWTADSWIMADVAADIPTKIDLRWMSRYGIFLWFADRAKKAGASFESYTPLVDVIKAILEAEKGINIPTKIEIDLKWFSKLLQATGLHPAWVPITTVAENVMVISDEMTLLRTGWLNLFKEGMLTLDNVSKYLSGMIVVRYKVGYWDPEKKKWSEYPIYLPVRWLPHEVALLELRMAMDRTLDVFREIYSYIRSGIRTLALTAEQAEADLKQLVDLLNTHYSKLAKEITGQDMELKLDSEYLKIWLEAQRLAIKIEAVERVRYWWYRVAGWILYRIAQGYTTADDIKNLYKKVAEVIPVTDTELNAYINISNALMGIIRKDYIPTPSQLATIAEIVPSAVNKTDEVLEKRNVPDEWKPLWKQYINVKPIADDVRRLMTAYERALRYNITLGDLENKVKEYAKMAGWTSREFDILKLRVQIEEMVNEAKEYLPTPTMLATLSEYLVLPENLVKETLEKRHVPKEWMDIWLEYIKVRPIKSDYRSLLSAYIRALRYNVITERELEGFLKTLPEKGFTPEEINVIKKRVELEEEIAEARAYLPTPTMLATLSEYLVLPEDLIKETLVKRHVPEEWMKIWLQYIKVRPIKSDYRSLLSVYIRALRYGVVTEKEVSNFIETLKTKGFTPEEINVIKKRVSLEVAINETRVYLPTPTMLATLSEYLVLPEDLIKKTLEERHVPKEWMDIWINYIKVRPIKSDYRSLLSVYIRALRYNVVSPDELKKFIAELQTKGFTPEEINVIERRVTLEEEITEARAYLPTPTMLATLSEYLVLPEDLIKETLKRRHVPEAWMNIWLQYIKVRPIKSDYRSLLSVYIRALRYNVVTPDELKKFIAELQAKGFTPEEISVIEKRVELEEAINETREYLPTPTMLATISEYVHIPQDLIMETLKRRRVPEEWVNIWLQYIKIRPVANEVRRLATAYYRALRYGVPLGDIGTKVVNILKEYGYTTEELNILDLATTIETMTDMYREAQREYIPTPSMLATMAEYVPAVRNYLPKVLAYRHVPSDWAKVWEEYVWIRPLANEVRRYLDTVLTVYEHFLLDDRTLNEVFKAVKFYGYEDLEIDFISKTAKLRRQYNAFRELVGTPRSMVTMAEYSPSARNVVISMVHKMIDELPIDEKSKNLLKAIWEEYIRIRPVYDEVRRYVTELIMDYARGIMSLDELKKELNELKKWGLDDYEIQFYIWLAERRKIRYEAERQYGYG